MGLEGRRGDLSVVGEGRTERVDAVRKNKDLKRLLKRIDIPAMFYAVLGVNRQLLKRSIRLVDGDVTSQSQSGVTTEKDVVSCAGERAIVQPAMSGTTTWSPKCSSCSAMKIHPPGPPRPRSNGVKSSAVRLEAARAMRSGRPRMGVEHTGDYLANHVSR